ncbi:copper chaperone PCu(A)C [Micromonospora zingiberis]|uniref:Copper chaperone PCu(A)C n=1 Tax=Micromonospora zingiberis TaxID=2053011 RepID=A0A4R0GPG2_9ACTN|nr:copper chaperone PCu(A)C [Micromonospora zingiberis]TCB99624.1 copper chaperone PCu(A)C [Micromonospora zingiberis]
MPSAISGRLVRPAALFTGVLLASLVAGCGAAEDGSTTAPNPSATATSAAPAGAQDGVLTVQDPWVKAADTGMTGAFATLVNDTDSDVTITGASSPVSPLELHEMAMQDGKMVMRAKDGGVVIKAGTEHRLEPGGDHLMLMNLAQPVRAGDEVSFTLTFGDGRTQTFTAVAKPFTGAQESYAPGHGEPMPGMSPSHSPAP